jgi:hypothetical protein
MNIIKSTLEHTFMSLCHDMDATNDELIRRVSLFRDINPLGPDVSIQMHAFIYSTSDGRPVLSAVAHLKNMVKRVTTMIDFGTRVNEILATIRDNVVELNLIRAQLSGVSVGDLPPFPLVDYSDRVVRTRNLLDAVRRSLVPDGGAESEPPAPTVDVVNMFDHNRFFFQGNYYSPPVLRGMGLAIANSIRTSFPAEAVASFVSSRRMDEIIGTLECVVKFYTGLLEQFERSIAFASTMFNSYTVASTSPMVSSSPVPPSSLERTSRDFAHVVVPPGSVRVPSAGAGGESGSAGAGAGAGAGEDDVDEMDLDAEEADDAQPSPKKRKTYRKRLPAPLGLEPAGATTVSAKGVKTYPKPQLVTMAGALMYMVEHVGLRGVGGGNLTGLVGRLPPTNVVRVRLEEFVQADMRDRYFPVLAKILVNYSHDLKLKRITDTEAKHQDLLRMLYLEEHQRVSGGGAKPTFEELVGSKPDMTPLQTMFTLDDLRENLLHLA